MFLQRWIVLSSTSGASGWNFFFSTSLFQVRFLRLTYAPGCSTSTVRLSWTESAAVPTHVSFASLFYSPLRSTSHRCRLFLLSVKFCDVSVRIYAHRVCWCGTAENRPVHMFSSFFLIPRYYLQLKMKMTQIYKRQEILWGDKLKRFSFSNPQLCSDQRSWCMNWYFPCIVLN